MSARNVLESQQSVQAATAGRAAAGCWKLTPGRALSLHPREPGVLEIAQGRVWLTLRDAQSVSLPADLAPGGHDHVLQAGDRLAIAAGQHAVMEVWSLAGAPCGAVAFQWKEAAALAPSLSPRAPRPCAEWEGAVVLPLRDLAQALVLGGRAVGAAGAQVLRAAVRVVLGMARFALLRIAAPRERSAVWR